MSNPHTPMEALANVLASFDRYGTYFNKERESRQTSNPLPDFCYDKYMREAGYIMAGIDQLGFAVVPKPAAEPEPSAEDPITRLVYDPETLLALNRALRRSSNVTDRA